MLQNIWNMMEHSLYLKALNHHGPKVNFRTLALRHKMRDDWVNMNLYFLLCGVTVRGLTACTSLPMKIPNSQQLFNAVIHRSSKLTVHFTLLFPTITSRKFHSVNEQIKYIFF